MLAMTRLPSSQLERRPTRALTAKLVDTLIPVRVRWMFYE